MNEQDLKLWKKYKSRKTRLVREEIVRKYLYLVKYVAGRVAIGLPPNVEFNDLVSYGLLGLFDAIEKYDVNQGNKFETYAVSRIRGAIMDELRKLDWAPRLLRKRAREIERKARELEDKYGRLATEDELAKSLNMSLEDLNGIYSELNSTTFLSLDEVWQNDDGNKPISRLQTVEDSLITNQFNYVHQNEVKQLLAESVDQLPEKEKLVIVLYYYENLTLREIGEVLNVSESRVCQIHTKVVMRLRGHLMKKTGEVALEI
ncbi:MAG: RNA polymerase sigma factor WhiG [Omnitrophica bacterium RIFCSPLOWO2_12_FULL_44_17]|uniref:RNA polymerase sigma factor n=1 Tax=Candidatus Danuiimicrobium aquiferis TaxID=1801832 RepID=A0A1G1L1R7_9BACT|nr:MAG: RNA polymerase sigma factor WhiG [Omnitrophica bacterium RIFCSPHIGHO2_02_FULL_45_28]OGW91802.1 MAG: RNA polymerase sigma factor WhiG [Omnitrophica bacterium RIFCSPHIGHO2_12_FULL_44_12]OGW99095.1 MAG: RNA polymerase sigma factor WhiG [Omnitrophica bacterium RIFCSPLOWO2_12_FULL_44_17]OGX04357.1 MAG: RNA polymerase sigma factor WhiG [Omnitrophica bacterium RIFCSPLOWO2_02_FULL_44_11]